MENLYCGRENKMKSERMKDEENHIIEELAKDIYSLKSCDTSFEENCKLLAYDLITLGWVKLHEDSIILSKEEYNDTINEKQNEAWDKGIEYGKEIANKETAEKIYKEYLCDILSSDAKEEFAKQFKLEIKE